MRTGRAQEAHLRRVTDRAADQRPAAEGPAVHRLPRAPGWRRSSRRKGANARDGHSLRQGTCRRRALWAWQRDRSRGVKSLKAPRGQACGSLDPANRLSASASPIALCSLSLFVAGCSSGCSSISRTPETNMLLPARSQSLALHLARGRGSPPLRFAPDPGTPFLDQQTSQMFRSRARCRVMWESERTAASGCTRTTTTGGLDKEDEQVGQWRLVPAGRWAAGSVECMGDGGWRAQPCAPQRADLFAEGGPCSAYGLR